jgi:hypothetical protein
MIRSVRVRMYRMGFGDSFLLSFDGDEGPRHILIDCGSITEGKAHVGSVAANIVEMCTPPGGGPPRLELVVATHRHRDHVGGFKSPVWNDVEVGEVWMPWTEDPDDPDARRILNRQSAFAMALAKALGPRKFDADAEPLAAATLLGAVPSPAASVYATALNALTNEAAMTTLHRGFAGRPPRRFLPSKGATNEVRTLAGVPGLRIHVLGPPRDETAMADMEPPDEESWLQLTRRGAAKASGQQDARPTDGAFRPSWRIDRPAFLAQVAASSFSEADERETDDLAEEPDGDLAAAIDRAVNNTSLILVFELGDQRLLFPGDAQWGGWSAALRDPASRRLLEQTTVYKVGHHGSDNATPASLVKDVFGDSFTALLSTRAMSQWPNLPFSDLLKAMTEGGGQIIRCDEPPAAGEAAPLFRDWEARIGA